MPPRFVAREVFRDASVELGPEERAVWGETIHGGSRLGSVRCDVASVLVARPGGYSSVLWQ